ncbi:Nedd8 ultimate buster [Thalictrum thalictroides]|uniref:Nedd8 ultimate buster n=1 Tax=Thalictrum thalictroides TaxID=46969 RepID=A0A7J6XGL9_THATH|nr:Nedd8 ultimate buster [Thalictrum thalictroides]
MDSIESSSKTTPLTPIMSKLKVAGAFSGILEVDLDNWTIPMLRDEIAKRANFESNSINLICAGKVLKNGENNQKLSEFGIKNNAKILATKVSTTDQGDSLKKQFMDEDERSRLLDRIRAAAEALTKRHADGSLPLPEEDYNIELEDQSGQKVHMGSETERRGAMMGLMLHANAKNLIRKQMYKEALDVLAMGEEAFSLCDTKFLEMIDNVPLLQIDTVWCYFMLHDIKWLSMAGVRLAKAREGIERCHGKDLIRVRVLQGGCHPELALYMRLELLEGVVAYHSEQYDNCKKALTSAQAKYHQLQVPDEALSLLMGMGYGENEAKRALRMNKQDVERAVAFIIEEREKKEQRRKEDVQRQKEIIEQKRYGMTPLKKAVNLQILDQIVSIGFERSLAAEALRRSENDPQRALDDLTNPETNASIQAYIDARKSKRPRQANTAIIEELVSLGFERSRVVAAVRATGTQERALNLLTAQHGPNAPVADDGRVASAAPGQNSNNSDTLNNEENVENEENNGRGVGDMEGPSGIDHLEQRDVDMEEELARELKGDALSDYDIEVTKEGEAITEYFALLASTGNN